MSTQPTVLFVCIHNAGRSQMAAGYVSTFSGGAITVRSGGSEPGNQINPIAIQAMAEEGIDISHGVPQLMTTEQVRDSDVVITMGCGDVCPIFPGERYEDWELTDPAGRTSTRCDRSATRSGRAWKHSLRNCWRREASSRGHPLISAYARR